MGSMGNAELLSSEPVDFLEGDATRRAASQ